MKDLIVGFGNQLRHALEIGANASLKQNNKEIHNVMITGLGGSGIGGTIVSELTAQECSVPVCTNKGYDLPGYINENTLVICSSFSGNTEETLEAFEKAKAKNAEIACVSSGGKLIELAKAHNLNYIQLAPGDSPRAMMGYSITQLLYMLNHYGLISDGFKNELNKTASLIDELQEEIQADAEKTANSLRDTGYTIEASVADLIDNSIEAGAKNISVFLRYTSRSASIQYVEGKVNDSNILYGTKLTL